MTAWVGMTPTGEVGVMEMGTPILEHCFLKSTKRSRWVVLLVILEAIMLVEEKLGEGVSLGSLGYGGGDIPSTSSMSHDWTAVTSRAKM